METETQPKFSGELAIAPTDTYQYKSASFLAGGLATEVVVTPAQQAAEDARAEIVADHALCDTDSMGG